MGLLTSFITLITTTLGVQAKPSMTSKPQSPRAKLLEEAFNRNRVPFDKMSAEVRSFLLMNNHLTECYHTDFMRWEPNQRRIYTWYREEYRIVPWVIDPKFVEAEMPEYAKELAAYRLLESHYTTPERIN